MEQGFVGKIFLEMEFIDINRYEILFNINIPIFHVRGENTRPQNLVVILLSDRISITLH